MPFWNDDFIYYGRKAVQTCLALREKLISPSCYIMKELWLTIILESGVNFH